MSTCKEQQEGRVRWSCKATFVLLGHSANMAAQLNVLALQCSQLALQDAN